MHRLGRSAVLKFALALSALSLASLTSTEAATVSLNPIADTFVMSAQPASNFGGAGGLGVSPPALPQGLFETLMKFDLASAKSSFDSTFGVGQWRIQSITLQLTTATPNNPIFNANGAGASITKWMQDDVWSEGTGTPSAPTTDGVTYDSLISLFSPNDHDVGTGHFPGGNTGTN